MGFQWQNTPEEAFAELGEAYAQAIHEAVLAIAQRWAPEIEQWMKQNAIWTDRTANARQTLWGDTMEIVTAVVLAFGHGVDYGTFLELAHGGTYAIVTPALDHFIPLIWQDVQALLS